MSIVQIAEGFFNKTFNKKEDLFKSRMDICRKCPLLKIDKIFGEICNPNLYINNEDKTSKHHLKGYVKGCGCVLASKTRVDKAKCIINKW